LDLADALQCDATDFYSERRPRRKRLTPPSRPA
jgi:hypothetical protein